MNNYTFSFQNSFQNEQQSWIKEASRESAPETVRHKLTIDDIKNFEHIYEPIYVNETAFNFEIRVKTIDATLVRKSSSSKDQGSSSNKWVKLSESKVADKINIWRPDVRRISPDNKKIKGLLNKLALSNCDIIIQETLKLNYIDTEILEIILDKIISEPKMISAYSRYIEGLPLIHDYVVTMCMNRFIKNKNKNLAVLIGNLFNKGIIQSIDIYTDTLKTYMDEVLQAQKDSDVEILCTLLKIVKVSKNNYDYIISIKDLQKMSKLKYMIMDVIDLIKTCNNP